MVSTSLLGLGKGFPGYSSGSCALEVDMSDCLSAHRSDMRERPCLSALALRDSFSLAWIAILLAVVLFSIGASLFPFIEHNDSNRVKFFAERVLPYRMASDASGLLALWAISGGWYLTA